MPSSCVSQEGPRRRSLQALKVPDSGSALKETEPPRGQEKGSEGNGQDVRMPPTCVLQTRSRWQRERETEASRPGTGGSRLLRNVFPRLLRSSHFYWKRERGFSAQGEVKMTKDSTPFSTRWAMQAWVLEVGFACQREGGNQGPSILFFSFVPQNCPVPGGTRRDQARLWGPRMNGAWPEPMWKEDNPTVSVSESSQPQPLQPSGSQPGDFTPQGTFGNARRGGCWLS